MDIIQIKQNELTHHPVYATFTNLDAIKHFMSYHVFAVWDFMSLLKSLQRHVTCVDVPWKPSSYSAETVRLVNQIVLGEESDIDLDGRAISHFDLYIKGMNEIGASTASIHDFLGTMDRESIPEGAREFVQHNLTVAEKGHVVEVAASFFFGREKLIPGMFQTIVDTLQREGVNAPTFLYYLERHIQVDGEEHGPMALRCLDELTNGDQGLKQKAFSAGVKALEMRQMLWDKVLETYTEKSNSKTL